MGRILAIDYGQKRTGLAVTDPLQITAGPLDTVPTADLLPYLQNYLQKESVERIILGKPTQTNGQDSTNLPRVMQFKTALERRTSVPVELWDERFTSVMAHQAMLDGGLKKKARQDKALVDRIAATIILQSYLEKRF